jgi:hypothetical protein
MCLRATFSSVTDSFRETQAATYDIYTRIERAGGMHHRKKMMDNVSRWIVFSVILGALGCLSTPPQSEPDETAGLVGFLRAFEASTDDIEVCASLFGEDVVVMLPDTPAIEGRVA